MLSIDRSPDRGAGMATTSFCWLVLTSSSRSPRSRAVTMARLPLTGEPWPVPLPKVSPRRFHSNFGSAPRKRSRLTHPRIRYSNPFLWENNVKLEVLRLGRFRKASIGAASWFGKLGSHIRQVRAQAGRQVPCLWHYAARGFGASPPPSWDSAYSADRLGDDVLAVLDASKLNPPVLAGHSLAGRRVEFSGIAASRRVSGLILSRCWIFLCTPITAREVILESIRGPATKTRAVAAGEESAES